MSRHFATPHPARVRRNHGEVTESLKILGARLKVHGMEPPEERDWQHGWLRAMTCGVFYRGGRANDVYLARNAGNGCRLTIEFSGDNNRVFIAGTAPRTRLSGSIRIKGSDCFVYLGRFRQWRNHLGTRVSGNACLSYFGDGGTIGRAEFHLSENGRSMIFGDQCMLAQDIYVRNSDGHGIFDNQTLERTNAAGDMVVGPRVWLGQRTMLLKAPCVGHDVVKGAGSIVTSRIASNSVAAGVPARVIRTGVVWDRSLRHPD